MADEAVVSLPQLPKLIREGIAATVDAIEVVVALSTLHEVDVPVSSCGERGGGTRRRSAGRGGITVAIHIVGRSRLLPRSDKSLVVDGPYLVHTSQSSVGLYAARVVVRVEYPLEVSADAVFGPLCQTGFGLQEFGKRLLAVLGITMQVDGTPGTIFTIEQLFRLFQFVVIVVGRATVSTTPVLDDVPVSALAAVAGGDGTLVATGGIKATDDVAILLGKLLRQHALVLQAPEDDAGRVAALLDPTYQQTLEILAEPGSVVPDMCRELAPEEDALFVAQLLIEQMVRLVCFAQGVKAGIGHLLHARANLFGCKSMAAT